MSQNKDQEIHMIKCPYCENNWMREDMELVCQSCIPALNVDLAVADIGNAISKLKDLDRKAVKTRIDIIYTEYKALEELIKKVQSK